jgi:aminoglycoside 3-N-acetyltransferase
MSEYIKMKDIMKQFPITEGDNLFITSDVKQLLYSCMENGDDTDLNILIDSMINIIGQEGTIVIPTFNWDFCKGKSFDYFKTPCKTGSIGKLLLKEVILREQSILFTLLLYGAKDRMSCVP